MKVDKIAGQKLGAEGYGGMRERGDGERKVRRAGWGELREWDGWDRGRMDMGTGKYTS